MLSPRECPTSIFSQQYRYITKKKGWENKENDQLRENADQYRELVCGFWGLKGERYTRNVTQ